MHALKIASVLILIAGVILFSTGVIVYWINNPVPNWASGFVMSGLLIILGAIILLCISLQYDAEKAK